MWIFTCFRTLKMLGLVKTAEGIEVTIIFPGGLTAKIPHLESKQQGKCCLGPETFYVNCALALNKKKNCMLYHRLIPLLYPLPTRWTVVLILSL